jgi:hypothetical protein
MVRMVFIQAATPPSANMTDPQRAGHHLGQEDSHRAVTGDGVGLLAGIPGPVTPPQCTALKFTMCNHTDHSVSFCLPSHLTLNDKLPLVADMQGYFLLAPNSSANLTFTAPANKTPQYLYASPRHRRHVQTAGDRGKALLLMFSFFPSSFRQFPLTGASHSLNIALDLEPLAQEQTDIKSIRQRAAPLRVLHLPCVGLLCVYLFVFEFVSE